MIESPVFSINIHLLSMHPVPDPLLGAGGKETIRPAPAPKGLRVWREMDTEVVSHRTVPQC